MLIQLGVPKTGDGIHIRSFLKSLRRTQFSRQWYDNWFNDKLSSLNIRDIVKFNHLKTFTLVVDYPFNAVHTRTITVAPTHPITEIIMQIAEFYSDLYKTPGQNDVYGHVLDDLFLESLSFQKNGRVIVNVGS